MVRETRGKRQSLDGAEYYAVSQGYLRERVCMGQCNLYIQVLRKEHAAPVDADLPQRRVRAEPDRDEGHPRSRRLPAAQPYNAVDHSFTLDQLSKLDTDVIDDRMIMVGHMFAVEAFMNRWNQGVRLSHLADVRDAFIRNYHRANRWHLAAIAMAEKMQFIEPQPEIRA